MGSAPDALLERQRVKITAMIAAEFPVGDGARACEAAFLRSFHRGRLWTVVAKVSSR
jgi:hypothetical protein